MDLRLIESVLDQAVQALDLGGRLHPWNLGRVEVPRASWLDRTLLPSCPPPWDVDPSLLLACFPERERAGAMAQIEAGYAHFVEFVERDWAPLEPAAVVKVQLGVPVVGRDRVVVRVRTENTFGPRERVIHGDYHAWLDRSGKHLHASTAEELSLESVWPGWVPGRSPGLDARVDLNRASIQELLRLPGLNLARADAIVAARPLSSEGELTRLKGFGPKTVSRLRDHIRFS